MLKVEKKYFPDDLFQRQLERIQRGWVKGPAAEFHQKFLMTTALHFEKLKFGGVNRGIEWPDFSPASFGRERPSGKLIEGDNFQGSYTQRLTHKRSSGSLLLQDTGRLKREAGKQFRAISATEVEFNTNLNYAQIHNEGGLTTFRLRGGRTRQGRVPARPFQFFTTADMLDLKRFTTEWLTGGQA